MNLLLLAGQIYNKITRGNLKFTFSQCGEDAIILFLIHSLKLQRIRYFDIGTNDPRTMNNTYLLYLNGYRGLCVEPDPYFHRKIKRHRAGDILIPAGVAVENNRSADFYIMDDSILNTFSRSEAERMVREHQRTIREKIMVPLIALNELFEKYYRPDECTILSLDVEGLDLPILQSFDFSRFRPGIICVETVAFSANLTGKKETGIAELLLAQNYSLYADTRINSIFIDNQLVAVNA